MQETATLDGTTSSDRLAADNWNRYLYGVTRGHREYTATACVLEGFYTGGQYDRDGRMLPGGHWNEADLAVLDEQGRPAYEFNQVMPAVNSAIGYQISNRMDIAFRPRQGDATKELAEVRSKVAMQIAANNDLHWLETEVFSDGMIQQRGYFECRMDFDDNLMGELRVTVLDPLDVIPDPDAKSYNPAGWNDVIITRWLTADEIEGLYGKAARIKVEQSGSGNHLANSDFGDADLDVTPRNKFGGVNSRYDSTYHCEGVLRYRIIDRQKWVREVGNVAIHPSGDIRPMNGDETPDAIAEMQRNGIKIVKRGHKRVRWIVSTIDTLLHDDWSPYDRLTVIPFFPFFRRGKTRGMVDNAIGPQKALDKGVSQAIHIINSTANSGWQLEENQLTNMTTEQLQNVGASTGLVLERKPGTPLLSKIQPNQMPPGVEKLIDMAAITLKDVTVPDAMRGMAGAGESGIAIQSKQHASQQGLAVPLDSLARTRNILARWIDYAISKYYDTERVFQITKTDMNGQEVNESLAINQFDQATGMYFNDMTAGEYSVVITEQPMQVTFENSQFTQALELRKEGVQIPDTVVVRHSNLSDKHEIIQQMSGSPSPEQIQEQIDAAVKEALTKANIDLKNRELDMKQPLIDAQVKKTNAESVNKGVEGQFGAIQTAQTITAIPQTAPLADMLLRSVGFEDQDGGTIMPNMPTPVVGAMPAQEGRPVDLDPAQVEAIQRSQPATSREILGRRNTSPQFPANPLSPADPDVGVNTGIEGGK